MTIAHSFRLLRVAALAATLPLAFAGCPYGSAVPIDDLAHARFDPRLLGKWDALDEGKREPNAVRILRLSEKEYLIQLREDKEPFQSLMRGYVTDLDGMAILNAQEVNDSEPAKRRYALYAYAITSGGELDARAVSDELVKTEFSSSRALRDYLHAHMKDPKLFEPMATLARHVEEPEAAPPAATPGARSD